MQRAKVHRKSARDDKDSLMLEDKRVTSMKKKCEK